jgi:uncharacterized membrane protein
MAAASGYTNTTIIAYDSDIYPNQGSFSKIDATNFYNSGIWDLYTSYPYSPVSYFPGNNTTIPYTTDHTLNYTNEGTMTCSVGWEFDYGPLPPGSIPLPFGGRSMSANFFNDSGATIEAVDGGVYNPPGLQGSGIPATPVSYLWIFATNIVNKGQLIGGASGEIRLTGVNVDLSRSHLVIKGISGEGSYSLSVSNFISDTAIYDEYWGQTNTTPSTLNSSNMWVGATTNAGSGGTFYVNGYVNGTCGVSNAPENMGFVASMADSTNIIAPSLTNIFRQAVFVYYTNPNITASNTFLSTGNISNLFQTATVRLTDSVSGESLYLQDTLGSSTNRGLLSDKNYVPGSDPHNSCYNPTYRPANYILAWVDPQGSFANGSPGAGPPTNNFLYDSASFTNAAVLATYAGYSAYINDLVNPQAGIIVIDATNLNLNRTVITNRGAEIVIQVNNLTGTPTLVSCQNLSFNIGSTNGYLNVTNLVSSSGMPGLNGTLSAFSAFWTNRTSSATYYFHVLLVDASGLVSTVPVTVQNLILNSTNMIVSDPMNVGQTLLFNGQSLTLLTNLTLFGNLQNWTYAIAPNLRYFTNNGKLFIPQDAHFGDDGPTNYAAFVNNGTITNAGGLTIDSDYFQNSGTLYATGKVFVITSTGLVANATITSVRQGVDFTGGALELTNATINVGNHLNFNMTNKLYDAGPSSGNVLNCNNGFSLLSASNAVNSNFMGDLLGTAIFEEVTNEAEVDHVWAGVDRGTNAAGFSNNVAIGYLGLDDNSAPFGDPLFAFGGTSTNAGITNGLYVTNLDLSGLTDPAYEKEIQIAPNLNIYYISVHPSGAAAYLSSHNFGGGHFVHVTNVTPVGYQPNILSLGLSAAGTGSSQQFQLTVNGVADQTFVLQASTDLVNWVNICTGTPPFIDPNASNYPTRFYRITTP